MECRSSSGEAASGRREAGARSPVRTLAVCARLHAARSTERAAELLCGRRTCAGVTTARSSGREARAGDGRKKRVCGAQAGYVHACSCTQVHAHMAARVPSRLQPSVELTRSTAVALAQVRRSAEARAAWRAGGVPAERVCGALCWKWYWMRTNQRDACASVTVPWMCARGCAHVRSSEGRCAVVDGRGPCMQYGLSISHGAYCL